MEVVDVKCRRFEGMHAVFQIHRVLKRPWGGCKIRYLSRKVEDLSHNTLSKFTEIRRLFLRDVRLNASLVKGLLEKKVVGASTPG